MPSLRRGLIAKNVMMMMFYDIHDRARSPGRDVVKRWEVGVIIQRKFKERNSISLSSSKSYGIRAKWELDLMYVILCGTTT